MYILSENIIMFGGKKIESNSSSPLHTKKKKALDKKSLESHV